MSPASVDLLGASAGTVCVLLAGYVFWLRPAAAAADLRACARMLLAGVDADFHEGVLPETHDGVREFRRRLDGLSRRADAESVARAWVRGAAGCAACGRELAGEEGLDERGRQLVRDYVRELDAAVEAYWRHRLSWLCWFVGRARAEVLRTAQSLTAPQPRSHAGRPAPVPAPRGVPAPPPPTPIRPPAGEQVVSVGHDRIDVRGVGALGPLDLDVVTRETPVGRHGHLTAPPWVLVGAGRVAEHAAGPAGSGSPLAARHGLHKARRR